MASGRPLETGPVPAAATSSIDPSVPLAPSAEAAAARVGSSKEGKQEGGSKRGRKPAGQRSEGKTLGATRLLCYCSKHLGLAEGAGVAGSAPRRRVYTALQEEIRAVEQMKAQQGSDQALVQPSIGSSVEAKPGCDGGSALLASRWAAKGTTLAPADTAAPVPSSQRLPPETIAHGHGSARCGPLGSRRSRGLREPDSIARAEAKRLYVRRTPYLVTGCVGRSPLPLPEVSRISYPLFL